MNFWRSFSKESVLKQLGFAVVLFIILIPIALWDSGTQVKVDYYEDYFFVNTDRYDMTIYYKDIASAELTHRAEPGEEVESARDDDIIRVGVWNNDTWGEYIICADLDADTCILLKLHDGRTLVYNLKNNEATEKSYTTLMYHLSN